MGGIVKCLTPVSETKRAIQGMSLFAIQPAVFLVIMVFVITTLVLVWTICSVFKDFRALIVRVQQKTKTREFNRRALTSSYGLG